MEVADANLQIIPVYFPLLKWLLLKVPNIEKKIVFSKLHMRWDFKDKNQVIFLVFR